MQTIRQIVGATPRASFARPYIREEEDGTATIKTGSPADAVRVIEALRAGGYAARLEGPPGYGLRLSPVCCKRTGARG